MEYSDIPAGYQRITPYLILENAEGFFTFTKNVFGAIEKYKAMRSENVIMHAEISIAGSSIMFADATEQYAKQTAGLFIYVNNCDETYQTALANGAAKVMEPADQEYGRSAGVKDPFGVTWWITSV